jgi:hypothetical protein
MMPRRRNGTKLTRRNVLKRGSAAMLALTSAAADASQQLEADTIALPQDLNLSGAWAADDRAIYYVRHLSDNTLWWAGLSIDGFHDGLAFTNVFHGKVDLQAGIIKGDWVDVPRGANLLRYGQLGLDIVNVNAQAVPEPSPQPGQANPPPPRFRAQYELHVRPADTTGEFGGTRWYRHSSLLPPLPNLVYPFIGVKASGGVPLGGQWRLDPLGNPVLDRLIPVRDFTVLLGAVSLDLDINFGWSDLRDYRTYLIPDFIRGDEGGDGDITFNLIPDYGWLHGQPDIHSGWVSSEAEEEAFERLTRVGVFHCEMILFGRANDPDDPPNVLLPGWAEIGGASMLVNGQPLNGNAQKLTDSAGRPITRFHISVPETPGEQAALDLRYNALVRVTGPIVRDLGHDDGRLEIHPVYAIDIMDFNNRRQGANLTGAWHASDVGTYYMRQVDGNTVWWLGLSRDQGRSFANVFRGTIAGNEIKGEWADIQMGDNGTTSSGTLRLTPYNPGPLSLTTSLKVVQASDGFGATAWVKLYDRGGGS